MNAQGSPRKRTRGVLLERSTPRPARTFMQGSFISEAEYRSRIAALEDALAERNTDGSIGTAAYARSYGLPVHP